jgi:hypothetical protein
LEKPSRSLIIEKLNPPDRFFTLISKTIEDLNNEFNKSTSIDFLKGFSKTIEN